MNAFDYLAVACWCLIQLSMLRYQIWAIVQTRRAARSIDGEAGSEVQRIARERQVNQWFRFSVILVYLVLGGVSFVPTVYGYGLFFILALLYGESVLFRNTRADVLLVKDLALDAERQRHPGTLPLRP